MQGAVREIALDVVRADGSVLPCLVNAVELRRRGRRPGAGAGDAVRGDGAAALRARAARPPSGPPRSPRPAPGRCSRWCPTWPRRCRWPTSRSVIVERGRAALGARGAALVLVEQDPAGGADGVPDLHTEHAVGLPDGAAGRAPARRRSASSPWSWPRGCGPCRSTTRLRAAPPGGGGRDGRRPGCPAWCSCRSWPTAAGSACWCSVLGSDQRRPDQPGRAGHGAGHRAGRRRTAVDPRAPGGAGAGAGPAARGDGAAGRARRVPARGRAAAGRRPRT